MDELISNLKTHELNKNQGQDKKEAKKGKISGIEGFKI